MYPLVAAATFIIGIIIFVSARKIANEHVIVVYILRIFAILLIIASIFALYLLLSGNLVLPLSAIQS